jgi:type I restriction enzyme R subunit
VATEKMPPPIEDEERGSVALTELFEEVERVDTPVMVKRIVVDIDEIVKVVRLDGWKDAVAGERVMKKGLRKT